MVLSSHRFGRKLMVQISYVLIVTFSATSATCHNIYLYMICLLLMEVSHGGYSLNMNILGKVRFESTNIRMFVCLFFTILLCTFGLLPDSTPHPYICPYTDQCTFVSSLIFVCYLFLFPAMEWMGISKRSWPAVFFGLFATVGRCISTGLVYVTRDWRLTQSISAALCAVSCIYIWYEYYPLFSSSFTTPVDKYILNRLIPESARWLLNRGRTDEAKQLICKVAKINKRNPPQFQQGPVRYFFH